MDTSYDVIISRPFGGAVVLSLLPFLPKSKETTIIPLDPIIEIPEERTENHKSIFQQILASPKTADEHQTEHPTWSRRDCVLMAQGAPLSSGGGITKIFEVNIQVSKL